MKKEPEAFLPARIRPRLGIVEIQICGRWQAFQPEALVETEKELMMRLAPSIRKRVSIMVYGN